MDQNPYGEQPPPIPPDPYGAPAPGPSGAPMPPTQPGMMSYGEVPGATAGLVLGICSIVFNVPLIGLVIAYLGFTKSKDAKTLCEMNPGQFSNYGIAQAGYICSIVGLCLGGLSTLCGCGYFIMIAAIIAGGGFNP